MRIPVLVAAILFALPAHAAKLERPKITLTHSGSDLRVVVHNLTDYCAADAETHVVRTGDTIRIQRDRPHRVGSCFTTQDVTFLIPNVSAGRYTVTYERLPLVAPVRWIQVASATGYID